jgi:hypothetical protein
MPIVESSSWSREQLVAMVLILLGVFSLLRAGVRFFMASALAASDVGRTLEGVRGLRAALVGGALVAGGVGLLSDSTVLIGLALIIGGEELVETSVVISTLRAEKRRRMNPA